MTLAILTYISLLYITDSQSTTIWTESFDSRGDWTCGKGATWNKEWTSACYAPYLDSDCPGTGACACVCVIADTNQWIERSTNIASYSALQLEFHLYVYSMNDANDRCEIWYSYDGGTRVRAYHESSDGLYSDQIVQLGSSTASASNVVIYLEALGDSNKCTDACYFDDVILKGISTPITTSRPTPNPTTNPTPNPTAKPTPKPTSMPITTSTSSTTVSSTTITRAREGDHDDDDDDDSDSEEDESTADQDAVSTPVNNDIMTAIAAVCGVVFGLCSCLVCVVYKTCAEDNEDAKHLAQAQGQSGSGVSGEQQGAKEVQMEVNMESNYNAEHVKIHRWFEFNVGYSQYAAIFIDNGYDSMKAIMSIKNKSEIKEIGVTVLGHPSLILSEIVKLNEIIASDAMDGDEYEDTTEVVQSDYKSDVYEEAPDPRFGGIGPNGFQGDMAPMQPMDQMHPMQQMQQPMHEPMMRAPDGANNGYNDPTSAAAVNAIIQQQQQRMAQMDNQIPAQQGMVELERRDDFEGGDEGSISADSFQSDALFGQQEKQVRESRR